MSKSEASKALLKVFFVNQQQVCTERWWQWGVLAVPPNAVEVVEQKSQAILSRRVAEMVSVQGTGATSETMGGTVEEEEAREGAEEAAVPSRSQLRGRHAAPPAGWGSRAAEESPFNSHRNSEAWSKHFLCTPGITLASNKLVTQEIFWQLLRFWSEGLCSCRLDCMGLGRLCPMLFGFRLQPCTTCR